VQAEAEYPDNGKSSPAAEEGTRAHALLEHCLLNGVPAAQVEGPLEVEGQEPFTPPQDMRGYVQVILDYVWGKQAANGAQVYAEMEVDASPMMGFEPGVVAGTSDVAIVTENEVEILDLKYGSGVYVEEKNNPQMLLYGAGVLTAISRPVERVTLTVAQPRYAGSDPIRSVSYAVGDFQSLVAEMAIGAVKALKPDAQRKPGDVQCQWCKARGDCPARLEKVSEVTTTLFKPIHDRLSKGGDVTGEQLAEFMDQIPLIENMIKDVRAEAYKRLEAGQPVAGYKLVAGRSKRAWKNEKEAAKKIKGFKVNGKSLGIDSVMPRSMISPAQAEKLPGLSVQHQNILAKLIEKTPGKAVIAPESSTKPAIVKTASVAPVKGQENEATIPNFM
jgi:hypothetical protein